MTAWAVLVAAGKGERMGLPFNKAFVELGGIPILRRSATALLSCAEVQGLVLVASPGDMEQARAVCEGLPGGKPILFAEGGETRQLSVANGLALVPADAPLVLVHDAARPLVSQKVIAGVITAAEEYGCAAPAIPLSDTIKEVEGERVQRTPDRSALRAVQTPQGFHRALLLRAHAWGAQHLPDATDDTLLVERMGAPVILTAGERRNLKITNPEDLLLAQALLEREGNMPMRVGIGYDVHRLVAGRKLILLGEEIPFEKGLLGHSDADVAAHALTDALLGAAAMGDIGTHFPDTDAHYKDADSMVLLAEVVRKLQEAGYAPCNVDITIIAQLPKLRPYIEAMRSRTAGVLGIGEGAVNVKATTTESLGFEGEGLGISAQAIVSICRLFP